MTIFVLFGQRKEDYPEQYAPEALAVISEYDHQDNPDYLREQLEKYQKTNEFQALRVCEVSIGSQSALRELLIGTPAIKGRIKPE